jgi:hypothetical protein
LASDHSQNESSPTLRSDLTGPRLSRRCGSPVTGLSDLTLEAYQQAAFGFLTVSAGPGMARIDYSTVVRRRSVLYDSVLVRPTI